MRFAFGWRLIGEGRRRDAQRVRVRRLRRRRQRPPDDLPRAFRRPAQLCLLQRSGWVRPGSTRVWLRFCGSTDRPLPVSAPFSQGDDGRAGVANSSLTRETRLCSASAVATASSITACREPPAAFAELLTEPGVRPPRPTARREAGRDASRPTRRRPRPHRCSRPSSPHCRPRSTSGRGPPSGRGTAPTPPGRWASAAWRAFLFSSRSASARRRSASRRASASPRCRAAASARRCSASSAAISASSVSTCNLSEARMFNGLVGAHSRARKVPAGPPTSGTCRAAHPRVDAPGSIRNVVLGPGSVSSIAG